jgi:hypothetical protein
MRDIACGDCVVTALLGTIPATLDDDAPMLQVLADAGLVAPLRLIRGDGHGESAGVSAVG